MFSKINSVLLLPMVLAAAFLAGCDASPPEPNLAVAKAKADQCVAPTEDIRRNHMKYMDVHRDEVMIKGVRTTKYNIDECINCHVAPVREDGSPVHYADKQKDHFCASCHTYVGVKIDCFQCHADRPQVADNPDYKHKLSSNGYHLPSGSVQPSLEDMLMVGSPKGAVQ